MRPNRLRHQRRLHWTVLLFLAVACSGSGPSCGGACGGCLSKVPNGFDVTKADTNAVQLRVTGDGFTYLSNNFNQIVGSVFPSGLVFDVPQFTGNAAGINYDVCNPSNAAPSGSPFGSPCGSGECRAGVQFVSMSITPQSPNLIAISAVVNIDTNDIDINTDNQPWNCVFLSSMHCGAQYCTQNSTPPTITANVDFSLDTRFWQLVSFNVTNVAGVSADANALNIYGKNTCGDIWCGLANVGFIKDLLVGFLNPQLQSAINNAVAKFQCRSCVDDTDCFTGPWNTAAATANHCDSSSKKCVSNQDPAHCVPTLIGTEGRIDLAQGLGGSTGLLGGLKNPTADPVDIFIGAGGSVSADTGLNLAMLGGAIATQPGVAPETPAFNPCVGDLPPPTATPIQNINFDNLATTLLPSGTYTGYHLGLGVSQDYLNNMIYSFHRGGALCITVDGQTSSFLSTGTFKALLPSLALVAGDARHDAPMLISLRPTKVPTITLGEGTYDPSQNPAVPVSPLLTLGMQDTMIDFYVLIDDRYVRIFTLTIDMNIPLSLIIEGGCNNGTAAAEQISVALGDLSKFFTNVRSSNASIIAEDPATLAQLIPMVIGIAQPALAKALKPFNLPAVSGFLVKLMEPACTKGQPCESGLRGIVPATAAGQFQAMGGFAQIRLQGGTCAQYAPKTTALLVQKNIPPASEMIAKPGRPLPWPEAVIAVSALSDGKPVQYAWRVDGGFWTTWMDGPQLKVRHPAFLAQGWHTIEVRARSAGDSDTIEQVPAQVAFLVDWQPPEISFEEDTAHHLLNASAWDLVTPPNRIELAYQLGDGAVTPYGTPRPVDLAAVEAAGGRLMVYARDEAGNVGTKLYRMPVASSPNTPTSIGNARNQGAGCGFGGGLIPELSAFSAIAFFLRRRRGTR